MINNFTTFGPEWYDILLNDISKYTNKSPAILTIDCILEKQLQYFFWLITIITKFQILGSKTAIVSVSLNADLRWI